MKKFVLGLSLVLLFSAVVYAQKSLPKDANPEQTKSWLKKNLVKKVSPIRQVKFNDCRISLKNSSPKSFFYSFRSAGNVNGGGFPSDDASNYLSSGPDTVLGNGKTAIRRIKFDLADLDLDKIEIKASAAANKSLISLNTINGANLIEVQEGKTISSQSNFMFPVKTKDAQKFVDAFKQAIQQCQ